MIREENPWEVYKAVYDEIVWKRCAGWKRRAGYGMELWGEIGMLLERVEVFQLRTSSKGSAYRRSIREEVAHFNGDDPHRNTDYDLKVEAVRPEDLPRFATAFQKRFRESVEYINAKADEMNLGIAMAADFTDENAPFALVAAFEAGYRAKCDELKRQRRRVVKRELDGGFPEAVRTIYRELRDTKCEAVLDEQRFHYARCLRDMERHIKAIRAYAWLSEIDLFPPLTQEAMRKKADLTRREAVSAIRYFNRVAGKLGYAPVADVETGDDAALARFTRMARKQIGDPDAFLSALESEDRAGD